jgi:branched-subunit amino acid aminotransferase/4-amino-4-deoxychorismate lyase
MSVLSQESRQIEIDGGSPSDAQLRAAALSGYGHFTAMQVRNRRVRGLDLHLTRLDTAHQEMFGTGLEPELLRGHLRHALAEHADASVRVYARHVDGRPSVMVTLRPPGGMPDHPWQLQSAPYQRPVAHIKHLGDFGQDYYHRLAERASFDQALLTGPGGIICEGTITNIGFYDGTGITWPDAPVLSGTMMQLLDRRLAGVGLPTSRAQVRMSDLSEVRGAFVTSARGIAPVGRIDDIAIGVDPDLMAALRSAQESVSWDLI